MRRHGEAVQLKFGHIAEFGAAEQVAHPAVEIAQLGVVQGIVQAQHGGAVTDFEETLPGLAADAARGGIRRGQLRMQIFQRLKPAHRGIVLRIGDFGIVENVVRVFVSAQILA